MNSGQEVGIIHWNCKGCCLEQRSKIGACQRSDASSLILFNSSKITPSRFKAKSCKLYQYPGILFNRPEELQVCSKLLGSLFPDSFLSCVAIQCPPMSNLIAADNPNSQPPGRQHLWLSRLLTSQPSVSAAAASSQPMTILK